MFLLETVTGDGVTNGQGKKAEADGEYDHVEHVRSLLDSSAAHQAANSELQSAYEGVRGCVACK